MLHKLRGEYPSRTVWLDNKILSPRRSQKVHNHSPDDFNWGYGGSGPAQLALAVVLEITDKPDGYHEFKWDIISKLPQGKNFDIEFEL